ncbi:MAG: ATP-binding cassette domain-containing protein [Candidatus Syntrophosphaera sp.]
MKKPIISVRNLEARYGETTILKDIELDIYPNEVTIILGGSGCGKTTLMKNILRLEEPYKGSVKYWDTEVLGMDESEYERILKKIGVLFQEGALLNSITVFDNIAIPLEQHTRLKRKLIERIIRVKLNLVRLSEAIHMYPNELSGGMKRRAALARALALDPQILFCDEPTSGLDPLTSLAMDDLLITLKNKLNMSIVIITHDLASIHRLADRIFFIESGTVVFHGTLNEAKQARIPVIDEFFRSGKYD